MRRIVRQKKEEEKKNWFPIVNVKVTNEGLYNQNMTISTVFQTAGPVATKLGLIVQHYKPECPAEKLDYCAQGQGHTEGKKCQ